MIRELPGAAVALVLVNWNGAAHLRRCLPSLETSLEVFGEPVDVIAVDNGSADGSREMLRQMNWIRVIENDRNRGFAAAVNQGIAASTAPVIVTLNNDTVVDPGWLRPLTSALELDSRVGSVAAQLRYLGAPKIVASGGIEVESCGISRDRLAGSIAQGGSPEPVFGASAGAAAYRREMLTRVGGFEERFFAYLEDVDVAWRARRDGWISIYAPASVVYHAHSGTAGQGSPMKAFLLTRNRIWLVARNQDLRRATRWLPRFVGLELGSILFGIVNGRSLAPVRGLLCGLAGLPSVAKTRPRLPFLSADSFCSTQSVTAWWTQRRQRDRLATRR